ncbi:MAG: amidohydrolase [Actinomycetota bacterium]
MADTDPLALTHARVLTLEQGDAGLVPGEAALIVDGVIAAVGSEEEIRARAPAGTEFRGLDGRTVVPGFVDAHIHPIFHGLSLEGVPCLPPRVNSIADLRLEVERTAAAAPDGAWVWGQGYDDTRLEERRHPRREDLDDVSGGRPVVLTRVCGHMCVANSRALELAGVDARTPDPPGGRIERDADGEPTGLLLENAEELVLRHVVHGRDAVERAIRRVSDDLLRHGITSCCDAWLGYTDGQDERDVWIDAIESGAFRPGISFLAHHSVWREDPKRYIDGPLDVIGVKLVADGSVSGGSAGVSERFHEDDDRRLFVYEPDELIEICRDVAARGLVVAIHAMGDEAISMALDAIEHSGPANRGHRIEHCTLPTPADIGRMARLGVTPVMQPIFLFAEGEAYRSKLGEERSSWANPARAMLDAGVTVALGSDAPATTWGDPTDVLLGIETSAVRRTWAGSSLGEQESTTVAEALAAYTRNAGRAAGFRDRGAIEPGTRADLAVLSEDPIRTPLEEIHRIDVTATVLGGEVAFGEL